MSETNVPQQSVESPLRPSSSGPKLKLILTAFLVFFSVAALVYVGYWYGKGGNNLPGESEGDEFQETDPNWKKAMENITPDPNEDKILKYLPYRNEAYKFTFDFPPTKVFIEETDGKNTPIVYLDTKLIVVPESYDSMLTPVEIHVYQSGETIEELKKSMIGSFYPDKYQEKALPGSLKGKGVRLEGTWKGYPFEDMKYEQVILQGPGAIMTIDYVPESFDNRFPQEYFDKIIDTFKFF